MDVKLRLTSHVLGENQMDHRQIRRFRRFNGEIHVNKKDWRLKIALAARQLQFERPVDVENTVHPPDSYRPASIYVIRRVFNAQKVEYFEYMKKGNILTIEFMIREDIPKHPNPHQFKAILNLVGNSMGFSQWGSKFGFGRFRVEGMEPKDPKHYE